MFLNIGRLGRWAEGEAEKEAVWKDRRSVYQTRSRGCLEHICYTPSLKLLHEQR